MFRTLAILVALSTLASLWMLRGAWGRRWWRRRIERSIQQFASRRSELQDLFLDAARQTGMPRGLSWKSCELGPGLLLARDRSTRDLYGLVGVTIAFEAIPGGGMEDVPAVGNLRYGSALFEWREDRWETQGRALLNLAPHEGVAHYHDSLEIVAEVPAASESPHPQDL